MNSPQAWWLSDRSIRAHALNTASIMLFQAFFYRRMRREPNGLCQAQCISDNSFKMLLLCPPQEISGEGLLKRPIQDFRIRTLFSARHKQSPEAKLGILPQDEFNKYFTQATGLFLSLGARYKQLNTTLFLGFWIN